MSISLGGIIVVALLVAVIVIGSKVRDHSKKLEELERTLTKEE